MNLDDPSISRFVLRLRNEFHNCWTPSCANDANAMQTAIQHFSNGVLPTAVDPSLITSKATTLYEGTIASGGNRYEANVIALYEFKTGQDCGTSITGACSIAFDTSGVDPAMDLTLSGNVQWFGGWGLNFAGGKAQASTGSSAKLKNLDSRDGRVLDRSVGRARQRRAGRHAHRQLFGELDEPQLQSRPDDVQLRLLQRAAT